MPWLPMLLPSHSPQMARASFPAVIVKEDSTIRLSRTGCDRAGARDYEAFLGLQPIMPLDLPVKVRSWELTVYPRSHIRRWFGVTRPAQARM